MEMLQLTPSRPIGPAFEISDLVLLQGWAEFHRIRMVVELDHWVEGEEYEEVVAFYAHDSSLRRWILWRSASDIVVQLLIGRTFRYASVADALDSLPATRPACQEGDPPGTKRVRRPRRSTSQTTTPRRAKNSAKQRDGSVSVASASPSVR